jgi:anti-sigma regulatory factor (Ser/Thr protein kinase)
MAPPERTLAGDYPAELGAAGRARRATVSALHGWGYHGALVDDAESIVGELAANAVLHAGSAFTLHVRIDGGILRMAVADGHALERGRVLAVRRPHGLSLVEALATHWGVERRPRGKVVWAELAA